MYLTNEQLQKRLNGNGHEIRKLHNGGRPHGATGLSLDEKATIGRDAIILGPSEAARMHDISQSRASLLADGVSTHGNGVDPTLKAALNSKVDEARIVAVRAMMSSLVSLEGKIPSVAKAVDLSTIATNMSRIVEKTGPKEEVERRARIVFYNPGQAKEESYTVVEVNT